MDDIDINIEKDILKRNGLKKELNSIKYYTNNIKNGTIKFRISHILNWYIRKAVFYKNLFYLLSVLSIIINSVIPIITLIEWNNKNILIACLSSIATIFTSFITLFSMKDTWFRYRRHLELIKYECIRYTCIMEKSDVTEEELALKIESIIWEERKLWENNKFDMQEKSSKE